MRVFAAFVVLAVPLALAGACTHVADLGQRADETGGGCGDGVCRPGSLCTKTCASCFCDVNRKWLCSQTCPTDGGTACPKDPPRDGTPCTAAATRCLYDNGCGSNDLATCLDGSWAYWFGRCFDPPPACPPEDSSPLGKLCPSTTLLSCVFKNACGSYKAYCDAATPWTALDAPPCTGECPLAPPPSGSSCGADTYCTWKNACSTEDFGKCSGGIWYVERTCLPAGCEPVLPKNGSPCKAEGVGCEYGDGCEPGRTRRSYCKGGTWFVDAACL